MIIIEEAAVLNVIWSKLEEQNTPVWFEIMMQFDLPEMDSFVTYWHSWAQMTIPVIWPTTSNDRLGPLTAIFSASSVYGFVLKWNDAVKVKLLFVTAKSSW